MVDALEDLRFDSLWLSERITADAPDPIIGLAVAAGRTQKLKLGTSVQVLPGRNPGAPREGAGHPRRALGRTVPPRVRPRHRAPGRAAGVRHRARRPCEVVRGGAAAAAPVLDRGRRRPRRRAVPLRGAEGPPAPRAGPARHLAGRAGAGRAAPRRAPRRRLARLVLDAGRVRGRPGDDRGGGRRARPHHRPRALRGDDHLLPRPAPRCGRRAARGPQRRGGPARPRPGRPRRGRAPDQRVRRAGHLEARAGAAPRPGRLAGRARADRRAACSRSRPDASDRRRGPKASPA